MTERMAGVVNRLEAGYRAKAIRHAVKMVEATVQLGGDINKESEEMQIEALKEALRGAKGNVWRREYLASAHPM